MQNKLLSRSFLLRCPRTLPCRCVLGVLSPASEKVSEKELQRDPRSSLVRKMPISASPGPMFTQYLLVGFTLRARGSWENVLLLLAPVPADQWLRCRCSPCLLRHLPCPGPIRGRPGHGSANSTGPNPGPSTTCGAAGSTGTFPGEEMRDGTLEQPRGCWWH